VIAVTIVIGIACCFAYRRDVENADVTSLILKRAPIGEWTVDDCDVPAHGEVEIARRRCHRNYRLLSGFATSRMQSMKVCTTGLIVRFFNVTIATDQK
jgi:hypothetical protein